MKNGIFAEVCCGSADDAILAAQAGADRIELNTALQFGGLTPSPGEFSLVRERVKIPVLCMLRTRPGGFCYTDAEFETILRDARYFLENGADGVVFGFLRQDGTVDTARCRELTELADGREAVFHRAFDVCRDPIRAIDALAELGVKRILTSGGRPSAEEGIGALRRFVEHAAGRIEILAGGGVRRHNFEKILRETGCRQVHFTCHRDEQDTSAAGNPRLSFNAPPPPDESTFRIVDRAPLEEFLRRIEAYGQQPGTATP